MLKIYASIFSPALGCGLFLSFVLLANFQQEAHAQVTVRDIAVDTRFQDDFQGHFQRGRALVSADFDLDGLVDFFIGNPGDQSLVYRNISKGGRTGFLPAQVLLKGALAWGAAAADYDNDGDPDLYVTTGANEGEGLDYLFKNMFVEEGRLRFEDVSAAAGVQGPIDQSGLPMLTASANAEWGDYDLDGLVDLFVSVNIWNGDGMDSPDLRLHGDGRQPTPMLNGPGYQQGQNILYRNNGDGTFSDVTATAGLNTTRSTRHSTWIDIDNDGDFDLYENNYNHMNVLWRNLLKETGTASFEDVTTTFSLPGESLLYPLLSFVSCAADFNNDRWDDLLVFMRNGYEGTERESPYAIGHAIFINEGGTGFRNAAAASGVNAAYVSDRNQGVMGSQVGDINADGVPDIFIGNGGPSLGVANQLYVSTSAPGVDPVYADWTSMIDFEAPINPKSNAVYPPYPYRTHGTALVDIDGDGLPEIVVANGGPAFDPDNDAMQNPNRVFKFEGWSQQPNYFRVRPVGDGANVNKNAIGARLKITVGRSGLAPWDLYQTQRGGSCFSAQNSFDLFFGLGEADTIKEMQINWPDGTITTITDNLTVNTSVVVNYDGTVELKGQVGNPFYHARSGDASRAGSPGTYEPASAYPNPFHARTRINYTMPEAGSVRLMVYDALGRHIATLADGFTTAGSHTAIWQADNVPSGLYFYRLETGMHSETGTMLRVK